MNMTQEDYIEKLFEIIERLKNYAQNLRQQIQD
jgi:hypothetical protein